VWPSDSYTRPATAFVELTDTKAWYRVDLFDLLQFVNGCHELHFDIRRDGFYVCSCEVIYLIASDKENCV
jgi:hypothetical protein